MKILLISPLQWDAGIQNWGAPSLGIMRIADYVKHFLPEVETMIFDSQIDKFDPVEKWFGEQIDIVGISLLHYTLINTLEFINRWKKDHPESLIVVGGNEAAANYQDIFDKSPVDIAVLAEGEETFLDIIEWKNGKKKLENISGIIYRKYANPINDNSLWGYWKEVDFSQHRYQDYWDQITSLYQKPDFEKINYVRLFTASHCQKHCTFCSLSSVRTIACGQVVKPASLRGWQIMELVHKIKKQLPDVMTIYFCTDDVFYPKKSDFLDFIGLYKKSGYNYRILIQTSSYSIEEEDFFRLKEINCQHITVGVENCSSRIRKSLGKFQDQNRIEKIIEWGKKYGIQIYYLIILIPPESTLEDLKLNYEQLSKWVLEDGIQISVESAVYVYRGTLIFESNYDFLYSIKQIGNGKLYKDPVYVLPKDLMVKGILQELLERKDEFINDFFKEKLHSHKFKGETGIAIVRLLGILLRKHLKDYNYEGL